MAAGPLGAESHGADAMAGLPSGAGAHVERLPALPRASIGVRPGHAEPGGARRVLNDRSIGARSKSNSRRRQRGLSEAREVQRCGDQRHGTGCATRPTVGRRREAPAQRRDCCLFILLSCCSVISVLPLDNLERTSRSVTSADADLGCS